MYKIYTLPFIALFMLANTAYAQHWLGAMDSNWNNPANWSQWPLDGENVTIDPANYVGVQSEPILSGTSVFMPDRLFVQGGALLTIDASLTVADRMIITGPAQVEMISGTLSSDRLIMDLGGLFHLSSGTVSVGTVLALADGDANDDSRFEQEGGTVSVSGELGLECETGDHEPTYSLTGGMLTVNGDVVWLGVAPGSGRPRLLVDGGNAQINGDLLSTANSTADLYVGLSDGGLTINGASIDMPNATDSLVQAGGALHLDNALVWQNDGVVHGTAGHLYVDQETELRGSGSYRFHHLNIVPGAVLQHTDPAEIEVGGDWNNVGTFDPVVNTVVFVGSGLRSVQSTAFFGLRMDNSGAGIELVGNSSVAGTLTLDNGVIHTQTTDLLTLVQNATSTSGSPVSHVDGPLRKIGNNAFVFPVGKNGAWRRIGIQDINDQNTGYTAEYVASAYPNTVDLDAGLSAVSTIEHWSLTRSGSNDDARVELFWEDAAASGITDCALVVVASWNGQAWEGALSSSSGSCAGNDPGAVESNASLSNYAAFTFGTADSALGIETLVGVRKLLPYPQPADTWTMFPAPGQIVRWEVRDELGRAVDVPVQASSGLARVGTADLPAGLYTVLSYAMDGAIARGRIMVVHR